MCINPASLMTSASVTYDRDVTMTNNQLGTVMKNLLIITYYGVYKIGVT